MMAGWSQKNGCEVGEKLKIRQKSNTSAWVKRKKKKNQLLIGCASLTNVSSKNNLTKPRLHKSGFLCRAVLQ